MTWVSGFGKALRAVVVLTIACALASTGGCAEENDLFRAAEHGDLSRVKALLAAKADVNATQGDLATALLMASENGHLEVVRTLLDAKADVNAKPGDGGTALMMASQNGHREVVRALLDAKADVNVKTANGTTALIRRRGRVTWRWCGRCWMQKPM